MFYCLMNVLVFPPRNRYFLDSKEDDERYFRIDEISGTIRTTQPLDREDTTWHNITVMASEVGRYPGTEAFGLFCCSCTAFLLKMPVNLFILHIFIIFLNVFLLIIQKNQRLVHRHFSHVWRKFVFHLSSSNPFISC